MKSKKSGFSPEWLPFSALRFDESYQRKMIPARVKFLVRNWDLAEAHGIIVSIRDGSAFVVDGQHRVRAALELGLGDTKVFCHVYRNLELDEEATKFLRENNSRPLSSFDKYEAGLTAKDPVYLGIQKTLAKYGLEIHRSKSDGYVQCVSKILALYEKDPEGLDRACSLLTQAWGTRNAAFEQTVFGATGMIVRRYNGELDLPSFSKKLGSFKGGPTALAGQARGLADLRPISVTRAAAEIMVDTYNKGRRSGALPPL